VGETAIIQVSSLNGTPSWLWARIAHSRGSWRRSGRADVLRAAVLRFFERARFLLLTNEMVSHASDGTTGPVSSGLVCCAVALREERRGFPGLDRTAV